MLDLTDKMIPNTLFLSGPASLWDHCVYGCLITKGCEEMIGEIPAAIPSTIHGLAGGNEGRTTSFTPIAKQFETPLDVCVDVNDNPK